MNDDRTTLRPTIPSIKITDDMSTEERFQNQILRPIIKMQHDLLINHFLLYLTQKRCVFGALSEKEQVDFVESTFNRDLPFRNTLQGMVIGHFTVHEYNQYIEMASEINKRIVQIIKERLLSSLDEIKSKLK